MNQELLRIVDAVARDKNIDREKVFDDLEEAIHSALRKARATTDEVVVHIDRSTGDIAAAVNGQPMSPHDLGRIAAQTAKQVLIQRIRAAERESLFGEYKERKGQIVTGRVARWVGGSLIVDLGRIEAILPKSEQIPGDSHQPEERIRAMILDVRDQTSALKIVLSRSHPDFIRRLFDLEVPEVAEKVIEIKAIAREAGSRSKVAVSSRQEGLDPVGATVGQRGARVQAVVAELAGEKIDVIPWSDDASIFVANALSPAQVISVDIDEEHRIASVTVPERMLSLAIGREGQNARLAARLTGWRIDIRSDVSVAEAKAAAADAVTAGLSSQIVAPVAEQAPAEAEPAPAPKPKRASKKTVAEQAPAEAEPVAEPAPKSKRATKKTVDIAPTEEVAS